MSKTDKPQIRVDYSGVDGPGVYCQMIGLGDDLSDWGLTPWYKSFDNLPQWLQNKVKLLQIMHNPPPAAKVEGVGEKIEDGVYWVEVE